MKCFLNWKWIRSMSYSSSSQFKKHVYVRTNFKNRNPFCKALLSCEQAGDSYFLKFFDTDTRYLKSGETTKIEIKISLKQTFSWSSISITLKIYFGNFQFAPESDLYTETFSNMKSLSFPTFTNQFCLRIMRRALNKWHCLHFICRQIFWLKFQFM